MIEDLIRGNPTLINVLVVECNDNRLLVREVLVQRADTNPGLFGHLGRGESEGPFIAENANTRIENPLVHLSGPLLLRFFPGVGVS